MLEHGRSGMSVSTERLYGLARRLAGSGFVVLIPHDFDATGDASADVPGPAAVTIPVVGALCDTASTCPLSGP